MKIVLDSNIIIADFWLESVNFKILFESSEKVVLDIFIPQIVLDEVINNYGKRISKSITDIESELNKLQKLTRKKKRTIITDEFIDSCLSKYKKHIKNIIKENDIQVILYPDTDHKFLANKAMLKLKPFNTNEKGYRDCLIWENIKSILTKEKTVGASSELALVSNNHKDFATSEFELHPDLIKELKNEDFNPGSVKFYQSLNEFNDKHTKPLLAQANTFEKKLKAENINNSKLLTVTNEYLYKNFIGSQLNDYKSYDECDSRDPTVRDFNDEYDIEIISVKRLTATEYIVDIDFDVETEIDFFMEKSEYYSVSENTPRISVEDADWNDHVMWVCSTTNISIYMTIIFDENLNVVSYQINELNENHMQ